MIAKLAGVENAWECGLKQITDSAMLTADQIKFVVYKCVPTQMLSMFNTVLKSV